MTGVVGDAGTTGVVGVVTGETGAVGDGVAGEWWAGPAWLLEAECTTVDFPQVAVVRQLDEVASGPRSNVSGAATAGLACVTGVVTGVTADVTTGAGAGRSTVWKMRLTIWLAAGGRAEAAARPVVPANSRAGTAAEATRTIRLRGRRADQVDRPTSYIVRA